MASSFVLGRRSPYGYRASLYGKDTEPSTTNDTGSDAEQRTPSYSEVWFLESGALLEFSI